VSAFYNLIDLPVLLTMTTALTQLRIRQELLSCQNVTSLSLSLRSRLSFTKHSVCYRYVHTRIKSQRHQLEKRLTGGGIEQTNILVRSRQKIHPIRNFFRQIVSLSTVANFHSGNDVRRRIVDLRSDTVTAPSQTMLQTVFQAKTGDDVLGEDRTVQELECYVADLCGKECGLYVPTGTMANLVAIMAHCNIRSSEILIGSQSHIALWEAGNAAGVAGVYTKSLQEDISTGQLNIQQIRNMTNDDDSDAHQCPTKLLCLENTHNMLGGIALPVQYMNNIGSLCHNKLNLQIHLDGARVCNAAVALNVSLKDLCHDADTVSICLSKGLGAPLGSVLVGEKETIRLAKRARKRCGGGMRQAGVVAAMGLYAIQNNYHRLQDDHTRAKRLATTLHENGFRLMRDGKVDTNIVYFKLPDTTNMKVTKDEFCIRLYNEYGVRVTGGYTGTINHGIDENGGRDYFRAVTHLDVNDDDIEFAANAMSELCFK
jgi:threonine aldolase